MLAVAIEHLEMRLGNSNLPLRKSIIQFQPSAHKGEIDKLMADKLYY